MRHNFILFVKDLGLEKEKSLWGEVEQAIIYFHTHREVILNLNVRCRGIVASELQKAE